jgi:hypothetical protein
MWSTTRTAPTMRRMCRRRSATTSSRSIWARSAIKDAPFSIKVTPAAPNAGQHRGAWRRHQARPTRTRRPSSRFRPRTRLATTASAGGADIKVAGERVRTTRRSSATVKDNKDGTYDVEYQPKGSGDFTLDVTLGGAHIKDAPFKVQGRSGQSGRRQHGGRAATASRRSLPARPASLL